MAAKYYISPGVVVEKSLLNNIFGNRDEFNPIIEEIVSDYLAEGSGVGVFVQATQPADASEGDLWVNSNSGRVYLYETGTWTSKYNPAIITENKAYTYSTYNKDEDFTSGSCRLSFTSGSFRLGSTTGSVALATNDGGVIGLTRTIGDIAYRTFLANNGLFDAVELSAVDNTDPLVVNSVVVSNGGNYITTSTDTSKNLTQVSTTPTTATIKYEDAVTPANSASVYCENTLVYIGGVDTIVSVNGATTAINSPDTTMNNATISGATIKLDGAIPTTAKKHTKIVKDANDDTLIDLPLLEALIQVATTSAIAVAHNDTVIEADASGGVITLTLPAASTADAGVKYYIFNLATSGNNVQIVSNGTDCINGKYFPNFVLAPGNGTMLIPISATKWFATTS
jgi:hypothetical protein